MDLYNLIISAKLSKGEGGDVSVDPLSVTENGTYTAEEGHAYSPVSVDVPSVTPTGNINITSTAQTDVSAYATAQVVDADLVASNIKKDVDILGVTGTYEGGGGGSSYELLHEEDIEASTTSTSIETVKNIYNIAGVYTSDTLYFKIRDKNPRNGYFYGTDTYVMNPFPANGSSTNFTRPLINAYMVYGHKYYQDTGKYGIFPNQIQSDGTVTISSRYNSSSSGTIDGTYHLEVYKLKQPDGSSSAYITPTP